MLMYVLIGVAALVVVLVAVIAMLPPDFTVTRSASISAPALVVFGQVNDLHNWEKWSPRAKVDPAMKLTYEGAPAGTGAIYSWVGNKKVGEGRLTVIESRPTDLIRLKLEFFRPFKATNSAEFAFKPDGSQTVVTWSMSGRKNFIFKAFGLFKNMDKMIGGDFEKGLANMKSLVETTK